MKALSLLAAVLLSACGGGGSPEPTSEPPVPPIETDPPEPASGMWRGTVASAGSSASGQSKAGSEFEENAVCLIDGTELVCWITESQSTIWPPPGDPPSGDPAIQEVGDLLSMRHGQITIDGASVPSGDGDAYANDLNHHCCLLNDGENGIVNTFTIDGGLVQAGEAATLEMTLGDVVHSEGVGIAQTITAPYDEAYENGRTIDELSRVYGETIISAPFGGLHSFGSFGQEGDNLVHYIATQGLVVDPDGSFFLQYEVANISCVHSGAIESGDGVNTHRLTMTLESGGAEGCMGTEGAYSGLAYVDETDALVIAVFDDQNGWVAMKAAP